MLPVPDAGYKVAKVMEEELKFLYFARHYAMAPLKTAHDVWDELTRHAMDDKLLIQYAKMLNGYATVFEGYE